MKSLFPFLSADHGPQLHRAARVAGAVAALVITWAWLAGEAAYDLGRQLRLALEERNDQLAAAWVALLGLTPAAPAVAAAPSPVPPAPAVAAPAPIALLPAPKRSVATRAKAPKAPRAASPRAPRSRKAAAA